MGETSNKMSDLISFDSTEKASGTESDRVDIDGGVVQETLDDDDHSSSGKGKDVLEKSKEQKEISDEKKELLKRREREASFSEEELRNLREQSMNLKNEGNDQFARGFWQEATQFYTKSLDICPLIYTSDRATYLSNRAAAYIKLKDWERAISDCSQALEIGALNDKPLERRAYCYAQQEEKYEQAIEDYQSLLKLYPGKKNIYEDKINSLKRSVDERNERMKKEMMSKLKDLGNMCLRPFGLSTDNFQLTQQPGGGYSISMKK